MRKRSSTVRSKIKIMMRKTEWREKIGYPIIGITLITTILYYGFDLHIDFPVVLWQRNMGFVGVDATRFVIPNPNPNHNHNHNGRKLLLGGESSSSSSSSSSSTLYVNGWNSYWLLEAPSRDKVSTIFNRAAQMGLNVCRTWAFSDGPSPTSLQLSPGLFNPLALQALDYVIVEARKNGIRLILSLVNNLSVFGGKEQYVKWAQEAGVDVASSADPFFEDSTIKSYYKAYLKAIITRRNSLSGVRYSEEPAIFAWELINEPRCDSNSSSHILQAWITEMAAYTKSLDQNHLVTVGLEGFYDTTAAEKSEVNPGEWAALHGTDFIQNSAVDGIDFASVHLYPDSWMPHANDTTKMDFISKWMDSHISDAENILKKPVLFTEVGGLSEVNGEGVYNQNSLFRLVYDKIFESAKKGQAGAGAMIWQLLVEGMEEYGDPFSLIAWNQPTTYKLIMKQSCRLQHIIWKKKTTKELDKNDPCYALLSQ